jgi:hypothetical protein
MGAGQPVPAPSDQSLDFQSKGSRSAALVYSVISRALLALATAGGVCSQTLGVL